MVDPVRHNPPPQPEPDPVPPPQPEPPPQAAPPGTAQNPIQLEPKPREPRPGEIGPHAPATTPDLDGTPDIPLPDTPGLAITADQQQPREPSLLDFPLGGSPAQTTAPANDPFSLPPPTRAEVSEVQLERVEDAVLAVPGSIPATAGAPTQPAAIDPAVQAELNAAVAAELAVSTNAELYVERGGLFGGSYVYTSRGPLRSHAETDALVAQRGESLVQAYGRNDPAVQAALRESIDAYRAQRWVQDAATAAQAIPQQPQAEAMRVRAFAEDIANVPPDLQARIPAAVSGLEASRGLLDGALKWATEPTIKQPGVEGAAETTRRFGELMATPMPSFMRDQLVREGASGIIDAYAGRGDPTGSIGDMQAIVGGLRGDPGTRPIADRITPELAALIRADQPLSAAGQGTHENAIVLSISESIANDGDPALAIELARQYAAAGDEYGAQAVFGAALQGFEQFANMAPAEAIKDHANTLEHLQSNFGALPPEDAERATEIFYEGDGRAREARDAVMAFGRQLIDANAQFTALPPELRATLDTPGLLMPDGQRLILEGAQDPGSVRAERLAEAFSDPEVQMAVEMADSSDPTLLDGENGEHFLETIADLVKMGDQGREFATRVIGGHIDRMVQGELDSLRGSLAAGNAVDPAVVQNQLSARIAALPPGVLQGPAGAAYRRGIEAIHGNLPTRADSAAQVIEKLNTIERELARLVENSNGQIADHSPVMRALRGMGSAAGIVALGNSVNQAVENGDAKAATSLIADMAGVTKGTAEMLSAFGVRGPDGAFDIIAGRGGALAQKLNVGLGAVALGGDVANVFAALAKPEPDWGDAAFSGLGLAGGAIMLSSSALAAGIGAPLVIASVVGKAQYEHVQQSNRFDNEATRAALRTIGFDDATANALADQSADGHSAVAPLFEYAEARGLNAQQTLDWINDIDTTPVDGGPSKLDRLRDNLHHTLDEIGGDLSRLPATDPAADAGFLSHAMRDREGVVIWTSEEMILTGDRTLTSMRQIDDVLQVLGIAPPPQPG